MAKPFITMMTTLTLTMYMNRPHVILLPEIQKQGDLGELCAKYNPAMAEMAS